MFVLFLCMVSISAENPIFTQDLDSVITLSWQVLEDSLSFHLIVSSI